MSADIIELPATAKSVEELYQGALDKQRRKQSILKIFADLGLKPVSPEVREEIKRIEKRVKKRLKEKFGKEFRVRIHL